MVEDFKVSISFVISVAKTAKQANCQLSNYLDE